MTHRSLSSAAAVLQQIGKSGNLVKFTTIGKVNTIRDVKVEDGVCTCKLFLPKTFLKKKTVQLKTTLYRNSLVLSYPNQYAVFKYKRTTWRYVSH